jgi:hypothetical protein
MNIHESLRQKIFSQPWIFMSHQNKKIFGQSWIFMSYHHGNSPLVCYDF